MGKERLLTAYGIVSNHPNTIQAEMKTASWLAGRLAGMSATTDTYIDNTKFHQDNPYEGCVTSSINMSTGNGYSQKHLTYTNNKRQHRGIQTAGG